MMIITDSASDITRQEAEEMNIRLVWLKTKFADGDFPLESEEDFRLFFEKLMTEKELPVTSQPSPKEYLELYKEAEKNHQEVLVITLSSGLSGTINAANVAKQMCGYDKIQILDSEQAIITQRFLVQRAALAVVGNMLHIKPVIELRDKTLTMLGKARGRSGGIKYLWKEFESCEVDRTQPVYFGFTSDRELGEKFMKDTVEKYGLENYRLYPVGGIIGTHVGPACVAISFVKK